MFEYLRKARRDDQGFTLIELLMVIVILGVLAGIAVFAVSGITDKGDKAACKADYKTVQVASEAYWTKNGSYATAIDDATHSATTLIGGGFLRSVPPTAIAAGGSTYAIAYTAADGKVAASGACTIAAG